MVISSIFIINYIEFMNSILAVFYSIKAGAESAIGLGDFSTILYFKRRY